MNTYKINLLPHRERARKLRRAQFYAILAIGGAIGVAGAFAWGQWAEHRKEVQLARNQEIEKSIKDLSTKIAEVAEVRKDLEALKARKDAVNKLQKDRILAVGFMKDLTQLTPDGIMLRGIKQEDLNKKITITGVAIIPKQVSDTADILTRTAFWIDKTVPVETQEIIGLNGSPNAPAQSQNGKKDQRKFYSFVLSGELKDKTAPTAPITSQLPGSLVSPNNTAPQATNPVNTNVGNPAHATPQNTQPINTASQPAAGQPPVKK